MSSGVPSRSMGVCCRRPSITLGSTCAHISVWMTPGATAFTRMPDGPSSCASALVRARIAPFVAEYAASHDAPICPHMELTLRIQPDCCRSIWGRAARMQ